MNEKKEKLSRDAFHFGLLLLLTCPLYLQKGGQTNPSTVRQTFGGVGRNLAGNSFYFALCGSAHYYLS